MVWMTHLTLSQAQAGVSCKEKNAYLPVVACRRQYAGAEGDPRYRRHWDRVGRRVAKATIVVGRSWAEVVVIASSSSDRIRGKRTKDKKKRACQ